MVFELLTNGKLDNYPKNVYAGLFKVRHWRDLGIATDEGLMKVLADCLDDVIDFEKTGIIKTVRELTTEDVLYLFFQQRLTGIGDKFNINYTCGKCDVKFSYPLSMKVIEENKLQEKLDFPVKYDLKLRVPSFQNMQDFGNALMNYMNDNTKKDYKIEVKEMVNDGEPDVEGKVNTKEVSTWEFDEEYFDLVSYYPYIANLDFRDIKEYLDFILDQDGPIIKYFDDFRSKISHGFKTDTKIKCKHCGEEESITIPIDPSFFLE